MEDIEKKCPVTEDEIILYADRELGETEKRRVENHIKICEKCRGLYETYVRIDRTASELFVSKRPLPEVRLEKPFVSRIADAIKKLLPPRRRLAFQALALAAFVFTFFLFYHNYLAPNKHGGSSFGRFACDEFQLDGESVPVVMLSGAAEIAEGSTLKAVGKGMFTSDKFDVIFKPGAEAKLGSSGIRLAAGAIDINYYKKYVPADFEISTPNAKIFIRGTRLTVNYSDGITQVSVAKGRVAVLKKEGELILNAGERAVVKKEGEPSLLPKVEEPVSETRETGLKFTGGHKNKAAAVPAVYNSDITEEAKVSEISRTSGTLQSPLISETVLKDDENATASVKTGEVITEKKLDYEVDLDSMDEKTRRIFFPKRP
jgi:hypothetical protein